MTKKKTPTAAARLKTAQTKLAALKTEAEAKVMEQTVELLESPQPVRVPWHEYPSADDFNRSPSGLGSLYVWSDVDDRTEGRYRPLYETQQDLMTIRAAGRKCREFLPIASGALESLTSYVIATGYEFEFQSKLPGGEGLALSLQPVLDRFLERNDFVGKLDQQIHEDSRVDGEVVAALYRDRCTQSFDVRVELIPPECILQPMDSSWIERQCGTSHKINNWWHGVHTLHDLDLKRDDVTRPLGYHVVFDRLGDEWDYLPANRVEFIKRNVGPFGRRGVSDFWLILNDLENEAKLRRNTAVGAAILAAIAYIRQHAEGATKASVEAMVTSNSTRTYQKPTESGARTTSVEHVGPGTVKDMPHGMQAMFGPLGSLNSPVYIEVCQFLMRVIGLRWNMPEYMISGDASNANFASTQQAGTPFVRARERDQSFYAAHFDSLIWKAMRLYHQAGQLGSASWEQIRKFVSIKVEYQSPENRDPAEKIATDEKLSQLGIKSKHTIATDHGLDYDEEQKSIKSEPKTPQPIPFRPSGFNPQEAFNARTESLAVRALDILMERSQAGEK